MQCPALRTDQSALHFTPWQTAINAHRLFVYKNQPLFVASYSFIQQIELWQCSVTKFVLSLNAEAPEPHMPLLMSCGSAYQRTRTLGLVTSL